MKIQPLPKHLFDKAKQLGAKTITLQFSGGSDEGYLSVDIDNGKPNTPVSTFSDLENEVEDWAWEVYEYSGAGDGSGDYGDDITYDLDAMTAVTNEWYQERVDRDPVEVPLEIANPDDE